ncbi:MAG: hypothetical protein JNK76_25915 [Planctomycetales bacterium]|nr:hypothetical protein [Planctomycetales bacterium]
MLIGAILFLARTATPAEGVAESGQAAGGGGQKAGKVELLATEADAVVWAMTALLGYPEETRPFVRFVWLPPYADPEWLGVVDFAMNAACSHTRVLVRGDRHAGGWLLGYDLRKFAPGPELAQLVATWDGLAVDESRFHVPQVNTTAEAGAAPAALLAPHLQEALARHTTDAEKNQRVDVLVTQLTSSTGGIYPADWLIEQLLTSLRGKYPEFRQMPGFERIASDAAKQESGTPFQKLLARRGFFFEASRDVSGDKGALLLISGVTGKSRIVMTAYGLASRQPMAVTFDFKDARTRPDQQFVRNLISFDALADAKEAFLPLPNGLIEYVLADGAGNLQRAAPADVVADATKPDGHTKEIEMGMSCVICHGPQDGYRTARNDMELLLGSDVDFFGDAVSYTTAAGVEKSLTREEAVAIVAGRYGERIDEFDGVLGRARRDFIKAVGSLTGYVAKADGETAVQRLGVKLKEIYHGYRYRTIDAERACLELGVRVPAAEGLATLRKLVPPPAAGQPEDVVIGLLRNGAVIKRDDFSAVYVEMARRAIANRGEVTQ